MKNIGKVLLSLVMVGTLALSSVPVYAASNSSSGITLVDEFTPFTRSSSTVEGLDPIKNVTPKKLSGNDRPAQSFKYDSQGRFEAKITPVNRAASRMAAATGYPVVTALYNDVVNPESLVNGNGTMNTEYLVMWEYTHADGLLVTDIATAGLDLTGIYGDEVTGEINAITFKLPQNGPNTIQLALIDEMGAWSDVYEFTITLAASIPASVEAKIIASEYVEYSHVRGKFARIFETASKYRPHISITGRAFDASGAPVAGAEIKLQVVRGVHGGPNLGVTDYFDMIPQTTVVTESDGTFTLSMQSSYTDYSGEFMFFASAYTHHYNICYLLGSAVTTTTSASQPYRFDEMFYWLVHLS